MADKNFSVLDMVDEYASENNIDAEDIFKKPKPAETSEDIDEEDESTDEYESDVDEPEDDDTEEVADEEPEDEPAPEQKPAKNKEDYGLAAMAALAADMPELQHSGAIYNKEDVKLEEEPLKNIGDEAVINESKGELHELDRIRQQIDAAAHRAGIKHLQIPPGPQQQPFINAASDPNVKRGAESLDDLINKLIHEHPEFIYEWEDPAKNTVQPVSVKQPTPAAPQSSAQTVQDDKPVETPVNDVPLKTMSTDDIDTGDNDKVSVVIDKRNVDQIAWSEEEVKKIHQARTVELNIVEGNDLEFKSVTNIEGNAVDALLDSYTRETHDEVAVLPASKYRATFTGLSYPDIMDLSASTQVNNYDAERLKWTICYSHIRNQSIGPWEEYVEYKDPETGSIIRENTGAVIPDNVDVDTVHTVSKFEDFMRKTSYFDLEFMLWKILCATVMDKETIHVTCKSLLPNGNPCNHEYDWIYSPNELLDITKINSGVLKDMEEAGKASSMSDILKIYHSSPVNSKECVALPESKFLVNFGHISANKYLEEIQPRIDEIPDESNDPSDISKLTSYQLLMVVKMIYLPNPKEPGKYEKVSNPDDMLKVFKRLSSLDYQTVIKLVDMETAPYNFKYVMKNLECPSCHNKSDIQIDSMSDLLFILARNLSNAAITFKRA